MDSNKYSLILLVLLIWLVTATGCNSSPKSTDWRSQPEPTITAFIGIPRPSQPYIQSENESIEEFIVRLAISRIIYNAPTFIVLANVKDPGNLYRGVSTKRQDIQKCWLYQDGSTTLCEEGDLENSFRSQSTPIIYFAFASSTTTQVLVIIDYYHRRNVQDVVDGYRLVIELEDNKWVEKSLMPVY